MPTNSTYFILAILTVVFLIWIVLILLRMQKSMNRFISSTNNRFVKIENKIHNELMEEKKAHLLLLMYDVREVVAKQKSDIYPRAISNLPLSSGINDRELAELFPANKALLIKQFWDSYQDYVEEHWLNKNGQFKTIFRGQSQDITSELGKLHLSSKSLASQMDHWLREINSAT
ncbi:hypothetical protein [Bacillus suaedae]|uniref:Uncharacterized protein n=1 Tax=Halalkalibacter suaedae TaxID=2822140 RepID=A0A940WQK0_9BACI|nr:hypothetical protein [Bacillus suaedae]MBP3950521.1 hypothetical protein [Bacillus suaedae]